MVKQAIAQALTWLIGAALVGGCYPHAGGGAAGPSLTLDITPQSLLEPQTLDWTMQAVSGRQVTEGRERHFTRQVLAFPTLAWAGLPLTSVGCAGTDSMPNGPAAAFRTSPADPLYNKVFFLTKEGKFIKIARNAASPSPAATAYTTINLDGTAHGNQTFSKTSVTLSPGSTRAYVLSDAGVFFVVNTINMTVDATATVAGGYGIAPWYDPYTASADTRNELYIAANDGTVKKFVATAPSASGLAQLAAAGTYNVATAVTPLYSNPRKVQASPIVLNGVIYLGDQAGNLQVYDTTNTLNNFTYGLGAPVNATPAIEIHDGTVALTDPLGNPKAVALGAPIYAFVNAGASCAWINLHNRSVTFSQNLVLDDADQPTAPARPDFGFLNNYVPDTSATPLNIPAEDGVNINTEQPERNLPGYAKPTNNDYLVPAETNTYDDGTQASGGPVLTYLRWKHPGTLPGPGSVVSKATLRLMAATSQACKMPEFKTTSAYEMGSTTTLWRSDNFTNTKRPAVSGGNIGSPVGFGVNKSGNATYNANATYTWDVSAGFSVPKDTYGLSINYNAGGDAVLWPEGPYDGAGGNKGKAKKAYQVEAVKFFNNPLNANGGPFVPDTKASKDSRPILSLTVSKASMPTPSIETPPIIDAVRKVVYVFYTNTLFQVSFASPTAWADNDPSGTDHTLFNVAYYGDRDNGGATYATKTRFVGNNTAPVSNYNLSYMYCVSRYPTNQANTAANWNYGLTRFSLPLTGTGNRQAGNSPLVAVPPDTSNYMIVDPFTNAGTTGGNVFLGLLGYLVQLEQ
jgi:hypothetical protein